MYFGGFLESDCLSKHVNDKLLAHQALGVVEYVNWADENRPKADKSSRYVRGSFDDQGTARQLTHAATADGSVQYLWRASHFEAMSAADDQVKKPAVKHLCFDHF